MTPEDLRTARRARSLSQTEAANLVAVNLRTFQRYEKGQSPIPDNVAIYFGGQPSPATGSIPPVMPGQPVTPLHVPTYDPFAAVSGGAPSYAGAVSPSGYSASPSMPLLPQQGVEPAQAGPPGDLSAANPVADRAEAGFKSQDDHIVDALRTADLYIQGLDGLPKKFGAGMPYQWAVSYWFDGAMAFPLVQYGNRGVTPCPAAYRAASDKIDQAYRSGLLWRVLAQLDECPPHIKARV